MTGESYARTKEYTEEYMKQAKQFGWDWEVSCPLCRRSLPEFGIEMFDYHHWHRDPDQGICLCRACHKGISGEGARRSTRLASTAVGSEEQTRPATDAVGNS